MRHWSLAAKRAAARPNLKAGKAQARAADRGLVRLEWALAYTCLRLRLMMPQPVSLRLRGTKFGWALN